MVAYKTVHVVAVLVLSVAYVATAHFHNVLHTRDITILHPWYMYAFSTLCYQFGTICDMVIVCTVQAKGLLSTEQRV